MERERQLKPKPDMGKPNNSAKRTAEENEDKKENEEEEEEELGRWKWNWDKWKKCLRANRAMRIIK